MVGASVVALTVVRVTAVVIVVVVVAVVVVDVVDVVVVHPIPTFSQHHIFLASDHVDHTSPLIWLLLDRAFCVVKDGVAVAIDVEPALEAAPG
eukprot:CAMPEP_0179288442 /NCGR_PEP_ID=MMETSP0797-20121207/40783_1 /TAXON_ID=47934 /ORGANISM="Dinophysis acuminata, Strain DAEP01" /LENGTH=92 /DNA_ID=CAMNT_0020997405 /DNA_START=375 /DNA_END=649 /DNA_ORIENTATION=+